VAKDHRVSIVALALALVTGCSSSNTQQSQNRELDAGTDSGIATPPTCSESDAGACSACIRQGALAGSGSDGVCSYLGIPYAKPPVDELRFAAPVPAGGWNGVRDATQFATACVQASTGVALTGGAPTGEDCLYLNVWTPATSPGKPLPVMVFIYGGGYTTGATNTYIGSALAARGPAVIVSMNYRLGALGFFAHPDLDKQRADKPSGSDAIRDQQLALAWVHDNIAAFHGDPANVTLFGESAGSAAIGVHVVSPGSHGLVSRFIMESGVSVHGVASGIEPVTPQDRYRLTEQMANDLCPGASDVIGCLRKLPADQIMQWTPPSDADAGAAGGPVIQWVPVIEGKGGVLPDTPDALMQSDQFNPGEILLGTNKNEFGFFQLIGAGAKVSTLEDMRAHVKAQFGDKAGDDLMAIYAPDSSVDPNEAYVTLMTDAMFRCQTRHFARLAAAHGRKVYLYSFEQGTAYHSEELIYVFGKGNFTLALDGSPDPSLVDAIQGYWVDFARTGNPNAAGLVSWPLYDATTDRHMTLVSPPVSASGLQKAGCDYWDMYLQKS
jgi:para-nitrobenzyl esterase